jgi:hypothetical protein
MYCPSSSTDLEANDPKDKRGSRRESTKSVLSKKSSSVGDPVMISVKVKVPKGSKPGDNVEFLMPGGRKAHIKVPKGARGGAVISVKVPKMGNVFNCVNEASDLTMAEIAKAEAAFHRIDADGSGYLQENEVRLLLMELGMDSSDEMIKEMMGTFDKDGDGELSLDEFKLLCANCPVADVDWSHLDQKVLAKIEKAARGDGFSHEGLALVRFVCILFIVFLFFFLGVHFEALAFPPIIMPSFHM